jgi:hypothetical protein
MAGYVYLLRTREFKSQDLPIYKIGKSTQPNFERIRSYGKGYETFITFTVDDCNLIEQLIKSTQTKILANAQSIQCDLLKDVQQQVEQNLSFSPFEDFIEWFELNYIQSNNETDFVHVKTLRHIFMHLPTFSKYKRCAKKSFSYEAVKVYLQKHQTYSCFYRERYRKNNNSLRSVLVCFTLKENTIRRNIIKQVLIRSIFL